MRLAQPERDDLKRQLKREEQRFADLDAQKIGLWRKNLEFIDGIDIEAYERVKRLWQDSAKQITHLHRTLYPYFPRSGTCYNCGSDLMPVLGGNPTNLDKCIACGQHVVKK